MATFKDNLDADFSTFFNTDEFAVDATYFPKNTPLASHALKVIFNNYYEQVEFTDASVQSTAPHIYFERDALPVTTIFSGDEVEIAGTKYTVTHSEPDGEGCVTVHLRKGDC